MAASAYQVYVASTLGFLLQLEVLPEHWERVELRALSTLIPGLAQWASAADAHRLRDMGFPRCFPDLRLTQRAAQLRVAACVAVASGGLRTAARARRLKEVRRVSEHLDREIAWQDWFNAAYVVRLDTNRRELAALGIDESRVEIHILGESAARPVPLAAAMALRRKFQRAAVALLSGWHDAVLEQRIRYKLSRFSIPHLPWASGERV